MKMLNGKRQVFLLLVFAAVAPPTVSPTTHQLTFSAPAQAKSACLPGVYDPSHIVQGGDCYTWSEFNKAMKAESQQPIIIGNRNVSKTAGIVYGEYFTSNINGSKGFSAETDAPLSQTPSIVKVVTAYTDIRLNDVNLSNSRPSWANINYDKSTAEKACVKAKVDCIPNDTYLSRAEAANTRVMFKAQTVHSPSGNGQWKTGKILFVFRNMNEGYGIIRDVDTTGANSGQFSMEPANPTQFFNAFLKTALESR